MQLRMRDAEVEALFREYGRYHASSVNRAAHWFGLPLIFVGAGGLAFHGGGETFGAAVVVVFTAASALVNARLGLMTGALAALAANTGSFQPVWVCVAAVAAGVVVPAVGHVVFERRWPQAPAQLARFELVGPLWFVNRVLRVVKLDDDAR